MPITATKRKDVVMVRFHAPEQLENTHVSWDVICYLRLTQAGTLEINYSHHVIRSRSASTGPFSDTRTRMPFDSTLQAIVTLGVMQELWTSLASEFRVLPGDLGTPIEAVEF